MFTIMRNSFLFLALVFCVSCSKDVWTGLLYPNKAYLETHINTGDFDSLESCRRNTINHHRFIYGKSDYECGLNCKLSFTGSGMLICKKTLR